MKHFIAILLFLALNLVAESPIPQGKEKEYAEALAFYEQQAASGDFQAALQLGKIFFYGVGVERDIPRALELLRFAASDKVPEALFLLARAHHAGIGVDQDIEKAISLYEKAGNHGLPDAMISLGRLLETRNPERSKEWKFKAALTGDKEGQNLYAKSLLADDNSDQGRIEARKWFLLAAEQGLPEAQYFAGSLTDDYREQARWFLKAAEQGVPEAQYLYAHLCASGLGVPRNYAKSYKWSKKAAFAGVPYSQKLLGIHYLLGNGVIEDKIHAYAWFSIFHASGEEDMTEILKELEDGMSPESLKDAQNMSEKFMKQIEESR